MKTLIKLILPAAFVALHGCAGTKVVSIDDNGNKINGAIAYQAKPYLWITADSSGKLLTFRFINLPDKSRPIVITPKNGLGSASTSFKLADGWQLTDFGSTSDSKIPETAGLAAGILTGYGAYLTGAAAFTTAEKNQLQSIKSNIGDSLLLSKIDQLFNMEIKEESLAGLYEVLFNKGVISGFKKVDGYPNLPVTRSLPSPCKNKECQCDYDGKKYSEGAQLEMGKEKTLKTCKTGEWK